MVKRIKTEPQKFEDIFKGKKEGPKLPAYSWQELALQVIKDLNIPNVKRSAVFKVCKDNPRELVLRCLNDTKELCVSGEKWRYFMKIITSQDSKK